MMMMMMGNLIIRNLDCGSNLRADLFAHSENNDLLNTSHRPEQDSRPTFPSEATWWVDFCTSGLQSPN